MTAPNPPALGISRPNTARVCNALLGGKDHYELDRVIAEPLLDSQLAIAMAEARRFARRAVEFLSNNHQVTQVVELGCGLPLYPDIGEIFVHASDSARILFIDNDLLATNHAQALLTEPNNVVAKIDLTDVNAVLAEITAVMDSTAPLAVCLSGTAELLADAPAVLDALTRQLRPGTWIVFSHITDDIAGDDISSAVAALSDAGIGFYPRDRDTITTMLAPYRLVDTGLIAPHRWRPTETAHDILLPLHPDTWGLAAYAAIGQLP